MSKKVTAENCFGNARPELVKEWDYAKNGQKTPFSVTRASRFLASWICSTCGHAWKTQVCSRLYGRGCQVCAGQIATESNNLVVLYPSIAKEWDYQKNIGGPEKVAPKSNQRIWWKCIICNYSWCAYVYNRTSGHGCPLCGRQVVTESDNLAVLFPEVAKEWDFSKNKKPPEKYRHGSKERVWWKCSKCSYEWTTAIKERTRKDGKGTGCPKCSKGNISKISQRWLDSLGVLIENREVVLQDLHIRVDGFDPCTNTVYEFLGDYWHGNPKIFSAEKINKVSKKTFGSLHKKTFDRINKIKEAGYNVVHIWENDFKEKGI